MKLPESLLLVIFYVNSTGSLVKKPPAVSIVFDVGTQFQKSDRRERAPLVPISSVLSRIIGKV